MSSWWWRSHRGWFWCHVNPPTSSNSQVAGGSLRWAEMSVFLILRIKAASSSCDLWWLMTWSGWWLNQPIWNIWSANWIISPKDRGEHKKYLKSPPTDFRISWPLHNTRIRDKLGCSLRVTHHVYGCSHLQRKSRQGFRMENWGTNLLALTGNMCQAGETDPFMPGNHTAITM